MRHGRTTLTPDLTRRLCAGTGACLILWCIKQENETHRNLLFGTVNLASSVPSTHVEPDGGTIAWGPRVEVGRVAFLRHRDTLSAWKQRADGGVHGLLLLVVLCQHSCSHGLVLNQIPVTFPLPCCVIIQADQGSTGTFVRAAGTSVPTRACGGHLGSSGGGGT